MIWGVNFVAIDLGLATRRRSCSSHCDSRVAVPLVFFVRRPDVPWRVLAAIGLFMSAGQFGLLFTAMHLGLPAGLAAVVLQCQMIFTLVIAAFVLPGAADPAAGARRARGRGRARDRGGRPARGGGGGGQRGGRGQFRCRDRAVVPLLVCVGAGLGWGTGNVVSRSAAGANGFGIVVWSALVVPLPVLGLSLILDGPAVVGEAFTSIGWQTIVSVAYTAGFASLVGYSASGTCCSDGIRPAWSRPSRSSRRPSGSSPPHSCSARSRTRSRPWERSCWSAAWPSASSADGAGQQRPRPARHGHHAQPRGRHRSRRPRRCRGRALTPPTIEGQTRFRLASDPPTFGAMTTGTPDQHLDDPHLDPARAGTTARPAWRSRCDARGLAVDRLSSLAITAFAVVPYLTASLGELSESGAGLAGNYDGRPVFVLIAFYAHIVAGGLALVVGPLQFWRGLRSRHRTAHRVSVASTSAPSSSAGCRAGPRDGQRGGSRRVLRLRRTRGALARQRMAGLPGDPPTGCRGPPRG